MVIAFILLEIVGAFIGGRILGVKTRDNVRAAFYSVVLGLAIYAGGTWFFWEFTQDRTVLRFSAVEVILHCTIPPVIWVVTSVASYYYNRRSARLRRDVREITSGMSTSPPPLW